MPPHRMPLRNLRMIEVSHFVQPHPKLLHHPSRPHIRRHGKRDNLPQPHILKSKPQRLARPFRRQPPPPELRSQPPANLYARSKARLKPRYRQSLKTRQPPAFLDLSRPQPKPMPLKMSLDPVHTFITLRGGQQRRKKLHHPRIAIHRSKWPAVGVAPPPQYQSLRLTYLHARASRSPTPRNKKWLQDTLRAEHRSRSHLPV